MRCVQQTFSLIRAPSVASLQAEPILGLCAACKVTVLMLARTLRVDPEVEEFVRLGDDPVLAAARRVFEECELLLATIDDYRVHLDERRHRRDHVQDWPF